MQMELAKKQKATTSKTRMPVNLRTAIFVLSTSPESEGVTTAVWLKYFLFPKNAGSYAQYGPFFK
jgi:hypothetical protein